MATIDPTTVIGPEGLMESLLEGVEFSRFPMDMIGISLLRAKGILTLMQSGVVEQQDLPAIADAAQAQVESALSLALAWDSQQRKQAN